MKKVKDIIRLIEDFAPLTLAEQWDNPGFSVGDENMQVTGVLTTLDCDINVVLEAEKKGCNMIVSHHPLIFRPLNFVTAENEIGKIILALSQRKIALYTAHTNLDCASGGINDYLSSKLGLTNVFVCDDVGEGNLVRIGNVRPIIFKDFAEKIANIFGKEYIRCVGDKNKEIKTVAVCGGGGGDFIPDISDKCDLYITGDVKYHMARTAKELGLCVAYVEHFQAEQCAKEIFCEILKDSGVKVEKSQENTDVVYDIFA
ncbi:MAG: Nif3-like dinuclear metal center hexameric protein [Clostridia bacterium]|nr:Nif3-like dinuclear metal center hexameric protein [Clostridia bacterium]